MREHIYDAIGICVCCDRCNDPACCEQVGCDGRVLRTKSGRIITPEVIEELAREAERGYCIAIHADGGRCFKPLPCPEHDDGS